MWSILLVQTQLLYPRRELSKLFVFKLKPAWVLRSKNCSRFCVGQNFRVQQLSTPQDFSPLNLKEFHQEKPSRASGPEKEM